MTPNVFMAQTHFVLPLDRVSSRMKKRLKDKGTVIPISFVSQRCEMRCRFIELERHPFYFLSRPDDKRKCYRRVELHAYLLSYKMYSYEKEDFFLVFGCSINKVFEESYSDRLPTAVNQTFSQRICTDYDLVYLQKAFRDESGEGLFSQLHDASATSYRKWIDKCVKEVSGEIPGSQTLLHYIPEYAAIDVRMAYVNQQQVSYNSEANLNAKFNEFFFKNDNTDFKSHWTNEGDTLLALCLIKGNENMSNVSSKQIELYNKSHAFTNNRFEMTFVGQNGIAFLRTHHPFLETGKNCTATQQETMPTDLAGVQNIYELCSVLSLKKRLERLRRRLDESPDASVRSVMARLAQLLNTKLTNVVDFGNKYRFVYEQMHVFCDFESLKQTGELRLDAYQLRLSQRINWIALLFTISAFGLAFLQILQNHVNSNNKNMNMCVPSSSSGDCTVMILAYVLAAIVVLMLVSRYILYPLIQELHKRLHRDMDDNL